MRCRHRAVTAHTKQCGEYVMTWETCARCGEWLPLGHSDEAPVAVEVRAAEISDEWTVEHGTVDTSTDEDIGWLFHFNEVTYGPGYQGRPENDEQHAGWLARVIHDREQMETPEP